MGYYIDIEKITIDEYQSKLESAYLPPSRMMLKDRLDERFGYFKSIGIKNLKELMQILKKKERFSELKANPVKLHAGLTRLNKEKNIYKGQIGLNDIKIVVNAAKEIPLEIEY